MSVARRGCVAPLCAALIVAAGTAAPGHQPATAPAAGPAFFLKSLQSPAERREGRPDVLDAPVLPGSIVKVVALAAALESQIIEPGHSRMCRRVATVEGRRYVCSHPDLKRPLTASEALAYSCNDYFVSLAPRLPRNALNELRTRVGLAPLGSDVNYAASIVGLDGPRVSPRALLDVVARIAGVDRDRPVPLKAATRQVILEGLRGAARFGSAAALGERKISALAKTGTAPMPGGSWMGLVVALEPADAPTRGIVVVAPGAAGLDAADIAADLLTDRREHTPPPSRSANRSPAAAESLPQATGGDGRSTQVRVNTTVSGRRSVVRFDLDDYIARVVAGEGEPRAEEAAQQALAITARTFALANLNRHRREGYDFCDTTHCQVIRPATAGSTRAATATSGRVLLSQGRPATVFYSAFCGGTSELASNVWPGAVDHLESSQRDEMCESDAEWESEVRVDQIEEALRDAGHRGGRLRGLRVLSRNASGRVARLQLEGFSPPEIAAADFRTAVGRVAGWQRLKSTAFEVRRTGGGFRFRGRGSGHGVGLCVIGAGRRAATGRSADEILRFYFPSLQIGQVSQRPALTTEAAPAATPARPAAPDGRADVRIALPSTEEGERGRVVDLIRRARDQIAAAAGVPPPATITVTVHPTVEAFGRATGQPWWMSAATDGTEIALLPLTLLRQRGQIERTIRHEVAHVLVDPVLAKKPLWVREGVALYFTDPGAPGDLSESRVNCPKDDEFLRPASAGTHRAAYARAESCVRRALAGGKAWRDIK